MRLYKVTTNKGREFYAHAMNHRHAMDLVAAKLLGPDGKPVDDDRVTLAITWEKPLALAALTGEWNLLGYT